MPQNGTGYTEGRFQLATYAKFNRPDPMRDWNWLRPHTMNLYEYVGNDPVNMWDPTGLISRGQAAFMAGTGNYGILETEFGQEVAESLVGIIEGGLGSALVTAVNAYIADQAIKNHPIDFTNMTLESFNDAFNTVLNFYLVPGEGLNGNPAEKLNTIFADMSEKERSHFVGDILFQTFLIMAPASKSIAGSPKGGARGNPLFRDALKPHKGGSLTKAGRALTKHPEVVGSTKQTLRSVLRSDTAINQAASEQLQNIMRNGVRTTPNLPRYGAVIQYQLPAGFGARWTQAGEFIGFINP